MSEASWCYRSQAWSLSLSTGDHWTGDRIWLATGCKLDVKQDSLLSAVMKEFPVQVRFYTSKQEKYVHGSEFLSFFFGLKSLDIYCDGRIRAAYECSIFIHVLHEVLCSADRLIKWFWLVFHEGNRWLAVHIRKSTVGWRVPTLSDGAVHCSSGTVRPLYNILL